MSAEPFEDLRAVRDAALTSLGNRALADQYERGAIAMAWEALTGQADQPLLEDTLRVELLGEMRVDAHALAEVSHGVQDAAAVLAKGWARPGEAIGPIVKGDRARALLVQQGQVGNVIYFRVPGVSDAGMPMGEHERAAQRALRELMEVLPRDAEDDLAVDGILGSSEPVRRAVEKISDAAVNATNGLGLSFQTPADWVGAVLTRERAKALSEELAKPMELRGTESFDGLMDGMRGTRRVFYLIRDDGTEIAGAVSEDLLVDVREHLNRHVTITVETRQQTTASGRPGRKAYRLLGISPALHDG